MSTQLHETPLSSINLTSLDNLKVIKRNGIEVPFDATKIYVALSKAFLDVEGDLARGSSKVHHLVPELTNEVTQALSRYIFIGGRVNIEDIQDQVELALMRKSEYKVARSYILYREEHRKLREAQQILHPNSENVDIDIILKNGKKVKLDINMFEKLVIEACTDLENVDPSQIIKYTLKNLFNGVSELDVRKALIMTARAYIETEPNYNYVAARLLLNDLRVEVCEKLKLAVPSSQQQMQGIYAQALAASIQLGINVNRLDPELKKFNLDILGQAIDCTRDFKFSYLGLQTLYDRYFLHDNEVRYELPQIMFMRVAMGLALREDDINARAIEFYNLLSNFDFMSSTPTLFNSGTIRAQLSSCFLTTIADDITDIFDGLKQNALLQKFAGGVGNDWTPIRGMNSRIRGTNGKSSGVIPFLKIANDTAVAVNQGGKRKGAVCAYLETWHLDIEEFLELRKNTGDERRRTHDMNTANWIPDLFMKRVMENKDWTLFSPEETPDLHELYGLEFEAAYAAYEEKASAGKLNNFKTMPAVSLWRKMLSMLFETGHPWITFKDPCNLRSPQQHTGVIHSSNLCTEITLNTSRDEIAVCNLGSINLPQHIDVARQCIDIKKLEATTKTALRMLDNVIDINYYSVPEARNSNLKHRPVGIGLMGFQDCLYKLNINYESDAAVEFADTSMEFISYYAIKASTDLAQERGTYASFNGSLWSQGILPIDSIAKLRATRNGYLEQDETKRLDWDTLRQRVTTVGMRNSNVMAIAPTATISNICGISQSIEPTYQNLYVKSNLSGEFTIVNQYLVMINDLKFFNGSVQKIERIPEELKKKYSTAFEIDCTWLIDCASRRQKWIDQAQSLNLYIANPSGKKLDAIYKHSWLRGLKTNYYGRSLGATDAEKSTVNQGVLNSVAVPKACSINEPGCESCQ
jgi:ribonucleoside-diphosphate reductase alpha chain